MIYPIYLTYDDQTRRLALDETPVSTGDADVDVIFLRILPFFARGETYHVVFKVLTPVSRGKVEFPSVKFTFDAANTHRWIAAIPTEVLKAVRHTPIVMQLRIGEGKHHYSFNTVQLTATKAIITK